MFGQRLGAIRPESGEYEQHRDYVLTVLARRCAWLDPSDREALLHDAFAIFLEKRRDGLLDGAAMRPQQVRAYLTQTALNKAMDEGKRAGRCRSISFDGEASGMEPIAPERDFDERIADSFNDARVREIVAELPDRQQTVVKLRFYFELTPDEIQRYLGVSQRVYRRELERAIRRIAQRYELVRQGIYCDSRRSLMLAFANGITGPRRTLDARRHVEACPWCSSWIRELRETTGRRGVTADARLTCRVQ
jgi:RNA polymerase sigma factor (sigma-70 family)